MAETKHKGLKATQIQADFFIYLSGNELQNIILSHRHNKQQNRSGTANVSNNYDYYYYSQPIEMKHSINALMNVHIVAA